jgi:hypothetical protein
MMWHIRKKMNIKLEYFETIGHAFQWFIIYEFVVDKIELFEKSEKEILNEIITTRILNKTLYHKEMDGFELEIKGLGSRPFEFEKIEISDFHFIHSKSEFEKWLDKFRKEGWEDDREDAQILIGKAEKELWSRTILENGVWHLSKMDIDDDSDKLIDIHWIYLHFETFIEIDKKNKLIRTFDFGYD